MSNKHHIYNQKKAYNSAKLLVVLKSLSQIVGMLILLALARILTVEEYGIYNVILSALTLAGGIASFGIANVLQRYLPEYIGNNDYYLAKRLFYACCSLRFLSILVCIVLVYYYRDDAFLYIQMTYSLELFAILGVMAVAYFQLRLTNLALYSFLNVKLANLNQIVLILIKAVGYGVSYFMEWAIFEILIVDVIAHLFCLLFIFFYWRREISPLSGGKQKLDKKEKSRLLRYGFFYNFNDVGGSFLGKDLANLVLLKYLEPSMVAVNALSYRLSDILLKFSPTKYFSEIIRPLLFSLHPENDKEKIKIIFSLLTKITLIVEIPILAFISLTSNFVISSVGGVEYESYGNILTIVLFISIIGSVSIPISYIAQLHERTDIILYSKITAILNVVLSIVLVQYYGIYGVLVATAISSILKNLFIWYFIRQYAPFRAVAVLLAKYTPIWGGVCVAYYSFFGGIEVGITYLVVIASLIATVFMLSIGIGLFNKDESEYLTAHSPGNVLKILKKYKVVKC